MTLGDSSHRGNERVRATAQLVSSLRRLAVRALQGMYRPEQRLFAFRLRRAAGGNVLEGISGRYTAIALLALADESQGAVSQVLAGADAAEVCASVLGRLDQTCDLGEVALALWAARALEHRDSSRALERLRQMGPYREPYPTVELAWSLTALCAGGTGVADAALADAIAARLLGSFDRRSVLFPHWPDRQRSSWLRSHVTCFADLVYPIQALSYYYRATGNAEALDVARRCASRMCQLQGADGQWWWHYDVRTGRVIEKYPVYAVHQDSMAPMALFALQDACGDDFAAWIERGLGWLAYSPELSGSLIDEAQGVIWRKVSRREPFKASRGVQALSSRVHPSLRIPGLDVAFRPTRVDWESRPYHMAWILHAWPANRVGPSDRRLRPSAVRNT